MILKKDLNGRCIIIYLNLIANLFIILCIIKPICAQNISHYVGYAYDSKTKKLLYTDTYQETKINNQLYAKASYRDVKNQLLAQKHVTFNQQLASPSFYFKNHVTGVIASVNVGLSNINVWYRPSFLKDFSKSEISLKEQSVVDAGFHYYVLKHWDSLLKGQQIAVNYIAPSRGTEISLHLFFVQTENKNNQTYHVFKVQAQSFLIRLFFPAIVLHYDANTKQLLRFEGLSNIKLGKKPNHVFMTFKYLNHI